VNTSNLTQPKKLYLNKYIFMPVLTISSCKVLKSSPKYICDGRGGVRAEALLALLLRP
jgi:hypothetical protein